MLWRIPSLVFVLVVSLGCCCPSNFKPNTTSPSPANNQVKKTYSRDEIDKLVRGKTQDDVMKLLGKPIETLANRDGTTSWIYREIVFDPIAQKHDYATFVYFDEKGICTRAK